MSETADYQRAVREAILDEATFLRGTFSGAPATANGSMGAMPLPVRGEGHVEGTQAPVGEKAATSESWEKVSLRPVLVGGQRRIEFACTRGKKHITKNFAGEELAAKIDELLAAPFSHIDVQSSSGDLHVRITRKGKALMSAGKPSRPEATPTLEHDHRKSYLLPADGADEFLRGVGIVGPSGKVLAPMAAKFRQINEYLRVIDTLWRRLAVEGRGLFLVDCGCGNAYLTFAAFHYLRHVRGLDVTAAGVDANADVIRNCLNLRDRLHWEGLDFQAARIADYAPPRPPDLVVSLHACDTATDDAIARGVLWGSRAILAAPCCQHELHHAIGSPAFRALLRHGVLRERLADLLTDALRAAALRAAGYSARVFEFVSPEHTGKNLMIAAEKVDRPAADLASAAREYLELKRFWNVTPFIEKAMGEEFTRSLARAEEGVPRS